MNLYHRNKIIQFNISTLNKFGFKTKVILNNRFNEECYVNAIIRTEDGKCVSSLPDIKKLNDYCEIKIDDLISLTKEEEGEFIIDFSIVPIKYGKDEFINANYEDIKKYCEFQEHFVEYYNKDYSFGVLYSIPLDINNKDFELNSLTLLQIPKLKINKNCNTYILLLNISSNIEYNIDIPYKTKIYDKNGKTLSSFENYVPANGRSLLNIKDYIKNEGEFYMEIISKEGRLIPLTIIQNKNNFSIEHSIHPISYGNNIFGNRKMEILKENLKEW